MVKRKDNYELWALNQWKLITCRIFSFSMVNEPCATCNLALLQTPGLNQATDPKISESSEAHQTIK